MDENQIGDVVVDTAIAVYLLNFGEALMKDGITRTVNGLVNNRDVSAIPAALREKVV